MIKKCGLASLKRHILTRVLNYWKISCELFVEECIKLSKTFKALG